MTSDDVFGRDLSSWLHDGSRAPRARPPRRDPGATRGDPPATVVVEPRKVAPHGYSWARPVARRPAAVASPLLVIVALLAWRWSRRHRDPSACRARSVRPANGASCRRRWRPVVSRAAADERTRSLVAGTLPTSGQYISRRRHDGRLPPRRRLRRCLTDRCRGPRRLECRRIRAWIRHWSSRVRSLVARGTTARATMTSMATQDTLVVDVDGTACRSSQSAHSMPHQGLWTPVWSPDGAWLAFTIAAMRHGSGRSASPPGRHGPPRGEPGRRERR